MDLNSKSLFLKYKIYEYVNEYLFTQKIINNTVNNFLLLSSNNELFTN